MQGPNLPPPSQPSPSVPQPPASSAYPQQAYPQQAYPQQAYAQQAYAQQAYAQQAYAQQAYAQQAYAQQAYAQQGYPQQAYPQGQMVPNLPPAPYNHMAEAILTLLFCCLPFGIVSVVYASQVGTKHAMGDIEGANKSAKLAGIWALVSCLVGVGVALLYFFAALAAAA